MKRKDKTPGTLRFMQWLFPKLERWSPYLSGIFFRLVFYVPLKYPVPEKEKEIARLALQIEFTLNGKMVRGYQWGEPSRPYILVMHGWAGRATQFRKFIEPLLGAGFRVIGFDGPAHGRSQGIQTNILEFELMLKRVFQTHGSPETIITHSFGGAAVLYAAMNGLPVMKVINIASPTIADEILKTYLRAIHGSWKSAERFKIFVKRRTGKSFEEYTSLHTIQHLPYQVDLLLVHDEDDPDVYLVHAESLLKVYPSAGLFKTKGLGHTRLLRDEGVIQKCLDFIRKSNQHKP